MKCVVCGKHFDESMYSGDYAGICGDDECFDEQFWRVRERQHAVDSFIIINGNLYKDAGNTEKVSEFSGHGGAKFHIRMNDGSLITTNNLWSSGDKVPPHHKNILRDNAKFER